MSNAGEWPAIQDPDALAWLERQNATPELFAGWARSQGISGPDWFERARAKLEAEDDALDLSPEEIARRFQAWHERHNTVHGILARYARARGLEMSGPKAEKHVRAMYNADLAAGAKVRLGKGRPRKDPPDGKDRPDDAALWAQLEAERAKVQRDMSATEAAGIVGSRYGLSVSQVMKLTARAGRA